jgi:TPR repeat protein
VIGLDRLLRLAADQGIADAQFNYGICLTKGEGVSKDLQGAAYYFKLAADQEIAFAQFNSEMSLHDGQDIGCPESLADKMPWTSLPNKFSIFLCYSE